MPPKGASQPAAADKKAFLAALGQPLAAADDSRGRREGRAIWRRMNRYEYENTLRDLLGAPWLQIKIMLPEDGLSNRFNKVGEALDVSYVQMTRYLSAAEYALREAMAKQAARPETTTQRYYARDQRSFTGPAKFTVFNGSPERATFPITGNAVDVPALEGTGPMTVRARDPARREREGMGVVASAYEPLQPKFNPFRAPVSGRYNLRLRGHSFWAGPENEKRWWRPSRTDVTAGRTHEPISLYAPFPPQRLRKLGCVDVGSRDRERLDQYMTGVRDLQQRMVQSAEWEKKPRPMVTQKVPIDPLDPREHMEKVRLMYDMAQLAFATDSTRNITLMLDSVNSPAIQVEGKAVSDAYHNLSHHGSNLGNANTHVTTNMPVLFAGGGFKHGRHLAFDRNRNYPLPNLFVNVLQRFGIKTDRFASSTGTMRGLDMLRTS